MKYSNSFHSKISTKPDLLGTFTGLLWIGGLQNMSVFTRVRCGSNGAGDGARHELRRGGCRSCQGAPAHPASPRHLSRQHVRCVNQSVSAHLPLRALLHVNADRASLFPAYRRAAQSGRQCVGAQTRWAPGSQGGGEEHQQHPIPGQGHR